MRTIDTLRSIAVVHPDAAEIGIGVATFVLVLAVSIGQWGSTGDALVRGVTLGGWMGILVYLVARRRRQAVERETRAAVEQRLRIARELHDTVAGTVSAIGIQAAAARRVLTSRPDEAATALERIEVASRAANADLRRMLEALRDGSPPQTTPEAGLDRLEALVDEIRSSGPTVRLTLDPAVLGSTDPALEHAAYRIVQEALTNVVRHAGAVDVSVDVGLRDGRSLDLAVVNGRGRGNREPRGTGDGLGLIGMRERAALFGGEVVAGPTPDGGFAVRATLPLAAMPRRPNGGAAGR